MTSRLGPRLLVRLIPILVVVVVTATVLAHTSRDAGTVTIAALAGLIAVGAAVIIAMVIAQLVRRDVEALGQHARAMLRGERRVGGDGPALDDLGEVGDWLTMLADDASSGRQALARERALSTQVLDGMSQGVVALDGTRRIVLINDTARTQLGLASSPLGVPLLDVVRQPELIELLERRADQSHEIELQAATGLRLVARRSRPLGEHGAVLILEDVTEMRRLESVRRDFVANVSHELRTPVSVIRANAETLLGGAKDDPQMRDRLVDGLHRNAERLALILADLLDLSRLDAGQYRFELGPVSLADAAATAAAALEHKAKERGTEVIIEVEPGLRGRADRKALEQVLVNLVENAVKYTPPRGRVWVAARTVPSGRVRIEIADDGPGIAPGHRARVFERFYRVDAGRSREAGGTGLGLAIVKHLVESMGGEIGVEANVPTGSRFWLELAAAPSV